MHGLPTIPVLSRVGSGVVPTIQISHRNFLDMHTDDIYTNLSMKLKKKGDVPRVLAGTERRTRLRHTAAEARGCGDPAT
jgi:hypothetical protein